jgi:hypothetical protein
VAFDATCGYLLDPAESTRGEALLSAIDAALAAADLPIHREPRSWEEVFARHTPRRSRKREMDVRLGFYGDEKYARLAAIAHHIAVELRAPERWPLADASERYGALPAADRFDHLLAMLSAETALLPESFPNVLAVPDADRRLLSRIASAPRLLEECETLVYCLGGLDPTTRAERWKVDEGARRGEGRGLRPLETRLPIWEAELDLCFRLIRVAENVMWSGAFASTH